MPWRRPGQWQRPWLKGLPKVHRQRWPLVLPVTVSFSRGARGLEEPSGRPAADFDAERVKAMRAAIESGTFRVNAEAIADRLLSDAQEALALAPARDG